MTVAAKRIAPDVPLSTVAAECFDEAIGDRDVAQDLLIERCARDPRLRRRVLKWAAKELIDFSIRLTRMDIRSHGSEREQAVEAQKNEADEFSRMARATARSWYDYVLTTGVTLQAATYDDVHKQAQEHRRNEASNRVLAVLFEDLSSKLEKQRGKSVGEILSESQIDSMYKKAGAR